MPSEEEYTLAGPVASRFESSCIPHRSGECGVAKRRMVTLVSGAEVLDGAMNCFRIRRHPGVDRERSAAWVASRGNFQQPDLGRPILASGSQDGPIVLHNKEPGLGSVCVEF